MYELNKDDILEIKHFLSWDSWKNKISELQNTLETTKENTVYKSDLLFRGHMCASWKLDSTLERKGIELPVIETYSIAIKKVKLAFESYLGSSWKSQFQSQEYPAPPEDYEFMVYLRHHGFPTPLIDWSRSAYIASYFAFQHKSPEETVAVYSFKEYNGSCKGGWTGKSNIVGCGPTIRTHKRHYMQQAEYTYCRKKLNNHWIYSSHEEAFQHAKSRHDILKKYTLPSNIRSEALQDLDSMNINAYTLYGSEEGLAEMLANRQFSYDF